MIISLLLLSLLGLSFYMIYRNNKVYQFQIEVLNQNLYLSIELDIHGASYHDMMMQFWRPLTLEEWLPQEVIDKYTIKTKENDN